MKIIFNVFILLLAILAQLIAEDKALTFKTLIGSDALVTKDDNIKIDILKVTDKKLYLLCRNEGNVDYTYFGSAQQPSEYEIKVIENEEIVESWDWCGTGKSEQYLFAKSEVLLIVNRPKGGYITRFLLTNTDGKPVDEEKGERMVKVDIFDPVK